MPLSSLTSAPSRRLLDLFVALAMPRPLGDVLATILDATADLLDCERASLLLYDAAAGQLRFVAATSAEAEALAHIPVPLDGSLAGTIFRERRPLVVSNVGADTRHFAEPGEAMGYRPRAIAGVPMIVDGEAVGVLEALDPRAGAFAEGDVAVLEAVAAQAAVAVHAARARHAAERSLERLAARERLRSAFFDAVAREAADAAVAPDPAARLHAMADLFATARHHDAPGGSRGAVAWTGAVEAVLPAGAPPVLHLAPEPLTVWAHAERLDALLGLVVRAVCGASTPEALDVCVDADDDAALVEVRGPALETPTAALCLAAAAVLAERDAATVEVSDGAAVVRVPLARPQ